LLAEHHAGVVRIVRHAVHALAGRGWRRVDRRIDAFVLRLPRLAAVVGAEEAGGRNADPHAVRILRVAQDRVRAKAAKAWRPIFSPRLFVEPVDRLPRLPAISADEEPGFGDTGIQRAVGKVQRPDLIDEAPASLEDSGEVFFGDE